MASLQETIEHTFHLKTGTQLEDTVGPGDLSGWDSVGHISLISALEATFGVELEFDEILEIDSIASIKTLLRTKGIEEF